MTTDRRRVPLKTSVISCIASRCNRDGPTLVLVGTIVEKHQEETDDVRPGVGSSGRAAAARPIQPLPPRWERTESEFDDWVAATTERADPFMAWLGVLFALLVGFDLAVSVGPGASTAIEIASWTIWAIFALELAIQVWLAPSRLAYLRGHWWRPVLLLLPFLRVLSFLRLARVGRALPASRVISSSYRAAGTARFLVRSRLSYLGAIAVVGAIAIGELIYVFERDAAGGAFDTVGDAMLWSLSAVIAMQADPVPESVGGRIVMLLGFVLGLILIASLAGVIGSFLVDERHERASVEDQGS